MYRLLVAVIALTVTTLGVCSPVNAAQPGDFSITDVDKIFSTASLVNQKSGSKYTDRPGLPVPDPFLTALDGQIISPGSPKSFIPGASSSPAQVTANRTYIEVFSNENASVIGTGYLTYTVVPNSTYNVDACLRFCDRVAGCAFANLYYEFNNVLLDYVFPEKSNLKCAVYADYHTLHESTNFGGQPIDSPMSLTFIRHSSGFAVKPGPQPITPAAYMLTFGPTDAANVGEGYMGFAFLDRYDVNSCAQLCNSREDATGARCRFFNIWRAEINDAPTTYTCAMYNKNMDASTASITGKGDIKVKDSRGYTHSGDQ